MRRRYRGSNDADLLEDGERLRVPMFAMDGMDLVQHAVARHSARVTDANGNSGLALHRPGFRFVLDDAAGDHAKARAYQSYQDELTSAYKNPPTGRADATSEQGERLCPDCNGSGEVDGEECDTCAGTGVVVDDYEETAEEIGRNASTHIETVRSRSDSRSISQMMRDHENRMTEIYDAYDQSLAQQWRQR